MRSESEFAEFVAGALPGLLRFGHALTGNAQEPRTRSRPRWAGPARLAAAADRRSPGLCPQGHGQQLRVLVPQARWPGTVYVTNDDAGTVTPINTATNTAGPPIVVGKYANSIAIIP
jgi:hypothetical protein